MGEDATSAAPDFEAWPEQMAIRAAWYYHMLGMTQAQVAEKLGLPRMRVNRLLAESRDRGLVTISINSRLVENVRLEEALCEKFALEKAHVAPVGAPVTEREDPKLAALIGRIAAPALAARIRPGMTIGVGWGITLRALASAMTGQAAAKVSVVSFVGSLNRRSAIDVYEATTPMAQKLSAECFYLAGPFICDSAAIREIITAQPILTETLERAGRADLAVLSVGGHGTGTVSQVGLVDPGEMEELRRAGSVGNFLGYFIDAEARVLDHPFNERVIGLKPDRLRTMPQRLLVSGGPPKIAAMRAVLAAGLASELVTDEDSARRLLSD